MEELRRLGRWVVGAVLGAVVLLVVALVGIQIALGTATGQDALRSRVETLLADATGARVSIGHIGGTLVSGIAARDVRLAFPGGTRLAVDELTGSYLLTKLLGGHIELGTVKLRGLRAHVVHTAEGWGLAPPGAPPEAAESELPTVLIPHLTVDDARVALDLRDAAPPRRLVLSGLSLAGALTITGSEQRIEIDALHAVPRGIDVSPLWADGTVSVRTDEGVTLDGVTVATRRSRLRADGTIVAGRRIATQLDLAPLSARELRAVIPDVALGADVTGTAVARGPWRRVAVRASLRTPASGEAALFGTLDAGAPALDYRATARVQKLDLRAIDGTLPASDLTGRVAGAGALATLETPLALRLRLEPSMVAGQRIDGARLTGRVGSGGLDAHGRVHVPAGAAALDGRMDWSGDATSYVARARTDVTDLGALVPQLPGSARLRLTVDGRGFTGPARTARVEARLAGGRVAGTALDRGRARMLLDGDRLRIVSAQLDASGLHGDGSGAVDLARETVDAVVTASGDISRAARSLGTDASGTISGRAVARGRLRDLIVDASATGERLRRGGMSADRASLTLSLGGVGGPTPGGHGTLDFTALRSGASPPWTGTVKADWRQTAGTDALGLTTEASASDGSRLSTTGSLRRTPAGEIGAQVAALTVVIPDHGTWDLTRPATLAVAGSTIAVDRLELASGTQRVVVAGRGGVTGPADATLEWRDIDLGALCQLRGGPSCQGRAGGNVHLTGTAGAPRLTLALRADDVVLERAPAMTIALTGDYAERALALRGTVTQGTAGQLSVAGTVPVDLAWDGTRRDLSDAPVEIALRTGGLDLAVLRLLSPDTIRESAGSAVADVRLHGSWKDLRADGSLTIRDGRLGLAATGVTYQGIEVSATARGQAIEVQTLRARGGDGTVEGSGQLALVLTPTSPLALRLHFNHFLAVARPGVEAATDGTLTVEGSPAYPIVRGELALTHLLIRPSVLTATSGPSLEPDPTIEVVGLSTPPPEPAPPAPSVAEAVSLAVAIQITHDAWIRRSDADVELRGRLQLGKEAYQPLFVTGDLRLVRGWYVFQGRRFTLQEGTITFGGDVPPDPMLDITATFRGGEYLVTIQVTGRASQPTLAMTSEPPLEQADILSVLVFGRPARDLGHNESVDLQRQALSLASGYFMPELRQSMMTTLGLDTLEVGDEGVRAGRYVTRDVFVTLAQDFTGRAGQVMGVDYAVTRRLSLKLSTSTRGDSAVDFLWQRRY